MAKQLQIRGGTTVQHSTFTGALREITIDTDKDVVVVHDGTTIGGFPLAKQTSVDSKVTKVTSTDNAVVRFNGVTGDVQNSSVVIDDNGNVGIGVTPSAWTSSYKSIGIEYYGAISSTLSDASINLSTNTFYNGTNWIYKETGVAPTLYKASVAGYNWQTAPSGTAGNAITWTNAMTLNSNGNLLVGTSTDNGVDKLQVNGSIVVLNRIDTISTSDTISQVTKEHTRTFDYYGGSGILRSVFGDVPTCGELYVQELGTDKYLNATFYKRGSSYSAYVTVLASNGLTLGNSNNQGTQVINGATNNANVIMMSKIRKIYT